MNLRKIKLTLKYIVNGSYISNYINIKRKKIVVGKDNKFYGKLLLYTTKKVFLLGIII